MTPEGTPALQPAATPAKRFKIVALAGEQWITGRKRATRENKTYYVKGFNFADDGSIRRVFSTDKREEAARFSTLRAEEIATQLRDPRRFGLFPKIEEA